MTDKEKAEKYVKNEVCVKICPTWKAHNGNCGLFPKCHYVSSKIKFYRLGLAEGFDKGYKKATERAYERQNDLTNTYIKDGEKIKFLGEENEELKAQVKKQQHQIEIICNTQKQRMMLLRYIRIKENLEAQIEKMKNCYNCKHNNEQDAEFCCNCDRPYEGEVIKDEWEIAE